MSQTPDFLRPRSALDPLCLGLSLSARHIGIVLAKRERLITERVTSLYKLPSREGREARFGQVLAYYVEHYRPELLVQVTPPGPSRTHLCVQDQEARVAELSRCSDIELVSLEAEDVRTRISPEDRRPSNRRLAAALCLQFPQLARKGPGSIPIPGAAQLAELEARGRRTVHPRERYWAPMFLALGGAVLALQDRYRRSLGV